jgi:CubicO group peptidase (beta-lactamase class C family)
LELIQKEVFDPLQMSNTRADKSGIKNDQRVNFYNTKPNYFGQAYPVNLSPKWAGGGFLSTSTDLVKAGLSVINDNYISEEARIILFTPPNKNGEGPCGYGFGWGVCKYPVLVGSDEPITSYSHGGSSVGGASFLMVIPDEGVVIAIHTNTTLSGGSNNMRLIVEEIASMILVSKRR